MSVLRRIQGVSRLDEMRGEEVRQWLGEGKHLGRDKEKAGELEVQIRCHE